MSRVLTPAQQKAKRNDEMACRVAFAIAIVSFVFAIVQQF